MSISPTHSWLDTLIFRARTALTRAFLDILTLYYRWKISAPKPNEIRSFKSHPNLKNRIFYPPNRVASTKLPILFDIHGGGFILHNPSIDDALNARISQELNCIVLSCDYSKSPDVQYPVASNEIVDTILDVLSSTDMAVDKSKVAVGGHSAGGNLTMSVVQANRLQNKIAAAVSWYPVTDFSDAIEPKGLLRPYEFEGEQDDLLLRAPHIKRAYIPDGQDLRDPRLSVVYADRNHLPKHILIFGAQNDFLCHEAWRMARRLTGQDDTVDWERDQQAKYGFEHDSIRWILVRGAKHGYTHSIGSIGEQEEKRKAQAEESFADLKRYMLEGPFK